MGGPTGPVSSGGGLPSGGGGGLGIPKSGGSGSGSSIGAAPVSLPLQLPPIKGVPAMLTAFALIAAVASSRILKVLADKAVAAKAGDRCPLEEQR